MLFSNSEFKKLSIIAFVGALFIIGGFYLTMLPVILQIIFLLIGVIATARTVIGLIKFLMKMNKDIV